MSAAYDVAVLGGGPAGMAAAVAAQLGGARTILLDAFPPLGGPVHRRPVIGVRGATGSDCAASDRLQRRLAASGAELCLGVDIWGLGGGPLVAAGTPPTDFRIDALGQSGPISLLVRALIVCAGANERIVPFPGWTMPGVFGLAAAMRLLAARGVLPGRSVVVAGAGPLLAMVTGGILRAGGQVAAVVDEASRSEWLCTAPAFAARPRLLARGAASAARIARAGVPVLSAHRVVRALGGEALAAVEVAPVAGDGARWLFCDVLCVGQGLTPVTEMTRLFGAHHAYEPRRGGWVPVLDAGQRSSVPLLYVAGDSAGIAGAAAAPLTARIAAAAALADLGLADPHRTERTIRMLRRSLRGPARHGTVMAAMMARTVAAVRAMPAETVVCRCEDVTRREIEAALDAGARDLNQLKQFTRCGMGPCQGRICGEAAAELVAARVGGREAAGTWTARIPLRPIPMSALLGDFDYADIPTPAPAPP